MFLLSSCYEITWVWVYALNYCRSYKENWVVTSDLSCCGLRFFNFLFIFCFFFGRVLSADEFCPSGSYQTIMLCFFDHHKSNSLLSLQQGSRYTKTITIPLSRGGSNWSLGNMMLNSTSSWLMGSIFLLMIKLSTCALTPSRTSNGTPHSVSSSQCTEDFTLIEPERLRQTVGSGRVYQHENFLSEEQVQVLLTDIQRLADERMMLPSGLSNTNK